MESSKRVKLDTTEAYFERVLDEIPKKVGPGWGKTYMAVYEIMADQGLEMTEHAQLDYLNAKRQISHVTAAEVAKIMPCAELTDENAGDFIKYKVKGWIRFNPDLDKDYFTKRASAYLRKKLALPREEWLKEENEDGYSTKKGEHYKKYDTEAPYVPYEKKGFYFCDLLKDHNELAGCYQVFGTYKVPYQPSVFLFHQEKNKVVPTETIRTRLAKRMQDIPAVRALLLAKYGTEEAKKAKGKKTLVEFFTDVLDEWVHS